MLFGLVERGKTAPDHASITVGVGFSTALVAYLVTWAGWIVGDADSVALAFGLVASVCTAMCTSTISGDWPRTISKQ